MRCPRWVSLARAIRRQFTSAPDRPPVIAVTGRVPHVHTDYKVATRPARLVLRWVTAGIPSWYVTSHANQLSLLPSAGRKMNGHNRHGPKTGGWGTLLPLWAGELGPHLTQYVFVRGLPPYQVASRSMQPFGDNRHGPKIGEGLSHF